MGGLDGGCVEGAITAVTEWVTFADENLPSSTLPTVAGVAAFGSTLALSTFSQMRLLAVSTGSPAPLPTFLGVASVALASLASHGAAVKTFTLMSGQKNRQSSPFWRSKHQDESPTVAFGEVHIMPHTLRICALGLIAFKLLGGRFWAVSPSSYTKLGSFARFSLPATEKYVTASQRVQIERFGRLLGCHTCGSRMIFASTRPKMGVHFVGDHMPPKAVAKQMNDRWFRQLFGVKVKYRFYPQCSDCSSVQGSILSSASRLLSQSKSSLPKWLFPNIGTPNLGNSGGGKRACFHGLRFRPSHLAGGIVAAVTVVDASNDDVRNGNRRRYQNFQEQAETLFCEIYASIRDWQR